MISIGQRQACNQVFAHLAARLPIGLTNDQIDLIARDERLAPVLAEYRIPAVVAAVYIRELRDAEALSVATIVARALLDAPASVELPHEGNVRRQTRFA